MTRRCTKAYLRCSSRSQDLQSQHAAIDQLVAARKMTVDEWVEEKGVSGKTLARPQLDRLREEIRAGLVGTVVCFKLDRLTRSGVTDTLSLIEEFKAHGCKLVTCADGIDFDGQFAEIVITVLSLAAKLERTALLDRQAAARAAMRAAGRPWGRPPRTSKADREKIIALSGTRSVRDIAVALHIPRSSVHRVIQEASRKSTLVLTPPSAALAGGHPPPAQK